MSRWAGEVPVAALLPPIDSYQAWTTLSITLKRGSDATVQDPAMLIRISRKLASPIEHRLNLQRWIVTGAKPPPQRQTRTPSATCAGLNDCARHAAGTEEQRRFPLWRGKGEGYMCSVRMYVHCKVYGARHYLFMTS